MNSTKSINAIRHSLLIVFFCFAATSPAWAQDGACTAPDRLLRAIQGTHTIPPFPSASLMADESGTTLLQVVIETEGIVREASVLQSSGYPRLDAAAMDHVKNIWRWEPPVQHCQPVRVATRVSIHWDARDWPSDQHMPTLMTMDVKDYPPGALRRREQGIVSVSVIIAADGSIISSVGRSSGYPELDQKAMELAKTWRLKPATVDGKPVDTPLYLRALWKLPPE